MYFSGRNTVFFGVKPKGVSLSKYHSRYLKYGEDVLEVVRQTLWVLRPIIELTRRRKSHSYGEAGRIGKRVNTTIDNVISQLFRGLIKLVHVGDQKFRTKFHHHKI
jgi:hypothetical protein